MNKTTDVLMNAIQVYSGTAYPGGIVNYQDGADTVKITFECPHGFQSLEMIKTGDFISARDSEMMVWEKVRQLFEAVRQKCRTCKIGNWQIHGFSRNPLDPNYE